MTKPTAFKIADADWHNRYASIWTDIYNSQCLISDLKIFTEMEHRDSKKANAKLAAICKKLEKLADSQSDGLCALNKVLRQG